MARGLPQIEHLLRRAGFGLSADDQRLFANMSALSATNYLLNFDQLPDDVDTNIGNPAYVGVTTRGGAFSPNTNIEDARQRWLFRMLHTRRPLQEKMTLFWHGHFATAISKVRDPLVMQWQNDTFRNHALGNFRSLVQAIARDTAMLRWLDGNQNRKGAPNEN